MSSPATLTPYPAYSLRGLMLGVAVAAIVLGILGLVLPKASLLTVAILFGINLLVFGGSRIVLALSAGGVSTGSRWLMGILGFAIVAAAVVCLADPFTSLQTLGFVIGIGWILEGISGILAGLFGYSTGRRWAAVVIGVIFLAAGTTVLALPVFALASFLRVGAIILIVLGVAGLLAIPREQKTVTANV